MSQKLTGCKEDMDDGAITVGEFNTPLSSNNRKSRQNPVKTQNN